MDQPTASKCSNLFFRYMADHWGYLLTDNMRFWLPYLEGFAESMRLKLLALGCDDFPEPGSFRCFGFLDNTLNMSCRPGGGPTQPGVDAPRNDPLLQRAFYNGWKKGHGLKWQTCTLPNGMDFHAWGPCSLRHNDLWTLRESALSARLQGLFDEWRMEREARGEYFPEWMRTFCLYGDSAYDNIANEFVQCRQYVFRDDPPEERDRRTRRNVCMSSCRETIEWNYGDNQRFFSYIDYKKKLPMRKIPLGDIFLCAMIMRNAMVAMRGNNTSLFFNYLFPHNFFETWVAAGPRM